MWMGGGGVGQRWILPSGGQPLPLHTVLAWRERSAAPAGMRSAAGEEEADQGRQRGKLSTKH